MKYYDNTNGMKVELYDNKLTKISIYDNTHIYLPFMNLKNIIDDTMDLSNSDGIYYSSPSKFQNLVLLSQNISKITQIGGNNGHVHAISPSELMSIAYTLPVFLVKGIIDHIRSIKIGISCKGSVIFKNEMFNNIVFEYLNHRDGLNIEDLIFIIGTKDPVMWNGQGFIPITEKQNF